MITLDHALGIIRRELKKSGYEVSERKSLTSNSVYFCIKGSGNTQLMFRVSDHNTQKNVVTLRVDMTKSEKEIVGFVKNRIMGTQKRALRHFYGMY